MNDPLTKLYAGLSDNERGKLAYAYLLQGNELERMRIESTMNAEYFVGLPLDYRRWIDSLQNLAMLYAIIYWKQAAHCLTLMAGAMAQLQDDDPSAYKPLVERFKAAEAALLAIEQAFDDVCMEHGLDRALMRFMAGNQSYQVAHTDLTPDAESYAAMRASFANLL